MLLLLLLCPTLLAGAPPPVVGGNAVPDGRWAETAAVYAGGDVSCTGVLVTPRWVLTAGHCTSSAVDSVYLGGNDLGDLGEGELIEVIQAIPYPEYWETWDVGLLELSREATTPPPEIALGCALDSLADGADAQIVGYGAIDEYGTRYTDALMEASVPITDADCDDLGLGCEPTVSPGGELLAGGDGADTCYGDSGGPLFLWTSYGVPALLGITSRGADVSGPPCATGGIYGRVDAVADWIETMTAQTLARPSCEPVENHAPAPTAETLVVTAGASAAVQIQPGDPDPYDDHTYTLTRSPLIGTLTLNSSGLVTYTAPLDSQGYDSVEVRVDDGELAASLELDVNIVGETADTGEPVDTGDEVEDPADCGCGIRTATGWSAWGWLPLALLATRSRRPGRRSRSRP